MDLDGGGAENGAAFPQTFKRVVSDEREGTFMADDEINKETVIELVRFVEDRSGSLAEEVVGMVVPDMLEGYRAGVPLEDLLA